MIQLNLYSTTILIFNNFIFYTAVSTHSYLLYMNTLQYIHLVKLGCAELIITDKFDSHAGYFSVFEINLR